MASREAAAGACLCLEMVALPVASQNDYDCKMTDCESCPIWTLTLHQCTEKSAMHLAPAILLCVHALLDVLFYKMYKGATSRSCS